MGIIAERHMSDKPFSRSCVDDGLNGVACKELLVERWGTACLKKSLPQKGSLPVIRRPPGAQLPYEMDPFGPKNRFYVWFQGRRDSTMT